MKVGVLATMMAFLLVGGFSLSAQAGPAPDSDSDGTQDPADFCSANPNAPDPLGCDTDMDGYGNACDGDLNNDGVVDGLDLSRAGADNDFLDCFTSGTDVSNIGCDLNCDNVIDGLDLSAAGPLNDFLDFFTGSVPPGPSGLECAGTSPCPM